MKTIKDEILNARAKHLRKVYQLTILNDYIESGKMKDEPIIKICPNCSTMNLHYNVENNSWYCAFC